MIISSLHHFRLRLSVFQDSRFRSLTVSSQERFSKETCDVHCSHYIKRTKLYGVRGPETSMISSPRQSYTLRVSCYFSSLTWRAYVQMKYYPEHWMIHPTSPNSTYTAWIDYHTFMVRVLIMVHSLLSCTSIVAPSRNPAPGLDWSILANCYPVATFWREIQSVFWREPCLETSFPTCNSMPVSNQPVATVDRQAQGHFYP